MQNYDVVSLLSEIIDKDKLEKIIPKEKIRELIAANNTVQIIDSNVHTHPTCEKKHLIQTALEEKFKKRREGNRDKGGNSKGTCIDIGGMFFDKGGGSPYVKFPKACWNKTP